MLLGTAPGTPASSVTWQKKIKIKYINKNNPQKNLMQEFIYMENSSVNSSLLSTPREESHHQQTQ